MNIFHPFNLDKVDPSWKPHIKMALDKMNPEYLNKLQHDTHWLPGHEKIFNAFSLPIDKVNYVLFGESPYPRTKSANGYAFWDAAVSNLWSPTGLSKPVNRATSLRNMIKMLLVAEGKLYPAQTSQPDIANLDKSELVTSNQELFTNFINHGFLLLNATLVLQPGQVHKDAIAWQPFIKYILNVLKQQRPHIQLILFGRIANIIDKLINQAYVKKLYAEHPYNHSFIINPEVLQFFEPLHLLIK